MNDPLSFFLIILITATSFPVNVQSSVDNVTTVGNVVNYEPCPFPMISSKLEGLSETDTSLCQNGCCLPCPIVDNFYKKGQIDMIFNMLSIIRVISFALILIIVISYIVLPNKRENSTLIVLYFNISILLFLGVTFFYIGDLRRIQCADLITQSTMENNALCGVQGALLIFSLNFAILWCFLLIVQLHLQAVWNSYIIKHYFTMVQISIVVISIVLTTLPVAYNEISFGFGAVCLISLESSNKFFWYPLSVFVIPGFMIHVWTFFYIGKSQCMFTRGSKDSTKSSKRITEITGEEIVRAVKVQWRALMLALLLLFTYGVYWSYDIFELEKLKPESFLGPWFQSWLTCIVTNAGHNEKAQDICSVHAKNHVPHIAFIVVSELLTATLGISIFIIFGTNINLWSEWKFYFKKKLNNVNNISETTSSDSQTWV